MQIFKRILKELGIALLFLLLILAVLAFVFYDKVPFAKQVPEPVDYANINRDDYKARGDLEEQANATQVFETSSSQLEEYLTEKIVSPGRFDPFNPINSVSDIPSDIVNASQTTRNTNTNSVAVSTEPKTSSIDTVSDTTITSIDKTPGVSSLE